MNATEVIDEILNPPPFVDSNRDLRQIEKAQASLFRYRPCPCGSGKKLKFCCWGK